MVTSAPTACSLHGLTSLSQQASIHHSTARQILLFKYYHVLEVANKLKVDALTDNLQRRYYIMTTYDSWGASGWNIQADNIKKVYKYLAADHPLRAAIVDIIARAWHLKTFNWSTYKEIEKFTFEVEEFWQDFQEQMAEIGQGHHQSLLLHDDRLRQTVLRSFNRWMARSFDG